MTNIHCQTKYDWYQTEEFVFIAIRQKGLSSADCSVAYDGHNLTVSAHDQVIFSAPLCHPINKESTTLTCTPSKVEVKLKKITGERWASLSVEEEEKRPSVSTKNWNVIEKEAENEEDSSDVQSLFHQIYKNADEDTRRAMIKSYTESCGTVLSTNWKEIGAKTTEVKPPDGLEFRKE